MVSFTYPKSLLSEPDKYRRDNIFRVGFTPFSNLVLDEA